MILCCFILWTWVAIPTPPAPPALPRPPIAANFALLRSLLLQGKSPPFGKPGALSPNPSPEGGGEYGLIDRLEAWCHAEGERLRAHFAARKAGGFIRECHGDLHLGNIAWVDGRPLIFDAIEFSPELRFIDVANEIAFLTCDLRHHTPRLEASAPTNHLRTELNYEKKLL